MKDHGKTIQRLQDLITRQKAEIRRLQLQADENRRDEVVRGATAKAADLGSRLEAAQRFGRDMEESAKHWWREAHRLARGAPIRHMRDACLVCEPKPAHPFVRTAALPDGALATPGGDNVFRRAP